MFTLRNINANYPNFFDRLSFRDRLPGNITVATVQTQQNASSSKVAAAPEPQKEKPKTGGDVEQILKSNERALDQHLEDKGLLCGIDQELITEDAAFISRKSNNNIRIVAYYNLETYINFLDTNSGKGDIDAPNGNGKLSQYDVNTKSSATRQYRNEVKEAVTEFFAGKYAPQFVQQLAEKFCSKHFVAPALENGMNGPRP
jgi:hypothetical protein